MKKTAFLLSTCTFWGFTLFSIIAIPLSLLAFLEYYFNWDFPFIEIVKRDSLDFAKIKNIGIEFWLKYTVVSMWATLIFYSIYFYTLKNFFGVFISARTFEEESLKQFIKFYKLNFVPVFIGFIGIIIQFASLNKFEFDEPHFFVILHLIVAFFLYFYLDLIRKGNNIQQENDLTI